MNSVMKRQIQLKSNNHNRHYVLELLSPHTRHSKLGNRVSVGCSTLERKEESAIHTYGLPLQSAVQGEVR